MKLTRIKSRADVTLHDLLLYEVGLYEDDDGILKKLPKEYLQKNTDEVKQDCKQITTESS